MTGEHRYILERGSKKHICPECAQRRFVRYFDTIKGGYLPQQYGRCDRESSCTYHLNPYLDGYAKTTREGAQGDRWRPKRKPQPKPEPVFIPFDVIKQTLQGYDRNTFIQNLLTRVAFPFDNSDIEQAIALYYLGTVCNGYRAGAVTFPFIDISGNVRAVQVKQFDTANHTTATDFLHAIIDKHHTRSSRPLPGWLAAYNSQDKRVSCLFGEHLLKKYPLNPVALVEAPKTAVYCSLYFGFPVVNEKLIWLAVYNKSSFSIDKLKPLKGRDVYTFPDLSKDGNTFREWKEKANSIENQMPGTKFIFSDLLEQLANESDRVKGNDIADYLIRLDWRQFRKELPKEMHKPPTLTMQQPEPEPQPKQETTAIREKCEKCEPPRKNFFSSNEQSDNWSNEIAELETFFAGIVLPAEPILMNTHSTILDITLFIKSHIATVKTNNGKLLFKPYLDRLREIKLLLTTNPN